MKTDPAVQYSETLRTPWYWWPMGFAVGLLIGAEFALALHWPAIVVFVIACLALVWMFGKERLEIRDGEIHIRGAHLPLSVVSGVVAMDARTLRRVVGPEGDPAAFVCIRAWIGPGVQLWLDDPEDPTPYWLISTRHPDDFVTAVNAAKAGRHFP